MKTLTIGIAGGTGSGKTTITKKIVSEFGRDVSVIHHDNYYKARDDMSFDERCKLNYDHPDAFETELLLTHLRSLKNGQAVSIPTYDYAAHNRAERTVRIRPARVLVVEGILIFAEPALCRGRDGAQPRQLL